LIGATGFESGTAALRILRLLPPRAVFIRDSRLLTGATGERFGRSREGFTVRNCQKAKSCDAINSFLPAFRRHFRGRPGPHIYRRIPEKLRAILIRFENGLAPIPRFIT